MPDFDYTVTIGTIVNLIGFAAIFWGGYVAFRSRVDTVLEQQRLIITTLVDRFESHEKSDQQLFLEIQRALGRLESKL